MSGQESRLLGRWGEALAADFLRQRGYEIVAAGWRCRFGELDLVAQDSTYLCFVEVKLRRSTAFGTAGEFVDGRKQQRLRTTAQLYLQQNPTGLQPRFDVIEVLAPQLYLQQNPTQLQPRFDVIEVLAPQGMDTRAPKIRHLADAF